MEFGECGYEDIQIIQHILGRHDRQHSRAWEKCQASVDGTMYSFGFGYGHRFVCCSRSPGGGRIFNLSIIFTTMCIPSELPSGLFADLLIHRTNIHISRTGQS